MPSLSRHKQRLRGDLSKEDTTPTIIEASTEEPIKDFPEASVEEDAIEAIEDSTEEPIVEESFDDEIESEDTHKLKSMTKAEIDMHAENYGIKLDRRQTKFNMIAEFIQKIQEIN